MSNKENVPTEIIDDSETEPDTDSEVIPALRAKLNPGRFKGSETVEALQPAIPLGSRPENRTVTASIVPQTLVSHPPIPKRKVSATFNHTITEVGRPIKQQRTDSVSGGLTAEVQALKTEVEKLKHGQRKMVEEIRALQFINQRGFESISNVLEKKL